MPVEPSYGRESVNLTRVTVVLFTTEFEDLTNIEQIMMLATLQFTCQQGSALSENSCTTTLHVASLINLKSTTLPTAIYTGFEKVEVK